MNTKEERLFILERDRYVCQYCGALARQRDHVFPHRLLDKLQKAGIDREDEENQVACCRKCNEAKGDRCLLPPSWAWRISELDDRLPRTVWAVFDGTPVRRTLR